MKTLNAKLLFPFIGLIFIAGLCSKEPTTDPNHGDPAKTCGDDASWTATLTLDNLIYNKDEGDTAEFRFELPGLHDMPEDICPDEHPKVDYTVTLKHPIQGLRILGNAYWGLYRNTINLSFDQTNLTYKGEHTPGLKQAFNEDPAWLATQAIFRFPDQGSLDANKAYIGFGMDKAVINIHYKKWKAK
jgi:hypothetical protein